MNNILTETAGNEDLLFFKAILWILFFLLFVFPIIFNFYFLVVIHSLCEKLKNEYFSSTQIVTYNVNSMPVPANQNHIYPQISREPERLEMLPRSSAYAALPTDENPNLYPTVYSGWAVKNEKSFEKFSLQLDQVQKRFVFLTFRTKQ